MNKNNKQIVSRERRSIINNFVTFQKYEVRIIHSLDVKRH